MDPPEDGESWRWRARIGNIMAAVFMSDSK